MSEEKDEDFDEYFCKRINDWCIGDPGCCQICPYYLESKKKEKKQNEREHA